MDSDAIQRSLTILEERYHELREIGQTRLQAWEVEKSAAAKLVEDLKQQLKVQEDANEQAHNALEEHVSQLRVLDVELSMLKRERDELAVDRDAAAMLVEDLKQQLEAQADAAPESTYEVELEDLRQLLEANVADLKQQLSSRDSELLEAREAAEMSLLQLQQVRKELQHFFIADGEKQRQLDAWSKDLEELRRSKAAQESSHELELEGLRERLEPRLDELEKCLATRDKELQEAREAAEISLLQLHQVQLEREQFFLADSEKQRQLEAGSRDLEELRRSKAVQESSHELELEALRERLEPRLDELEKCLATRDKELQEAREAAEISLLQLHQVQLEREQFFLADSEKQRQLEAGSRDLEELRRSKAVQESSHELELEALRERLEPRLDELEKCLATRDKELQEAREAAEISLLQLHQVQLEREQFFLADSEKQRQLEAGSRDLEELRRSKAVQESSHELELEALRERLEPRLDELEKCLATRDKELQEAREAAEISLLQLQQVQVELEHYFIADRDKLRQLEAQDRELVEVRQAKAAQESVLAQELESFRERLEPRLAELENCLASRDKELREARQTADLTTLQLHQVQVELEHYFSADRDKLRQLEALDRELVELRRTKASQESALVQELEVLRERLEPRLAELEHCLASRDKELREAREAADFSLLQLHQMQEELEHYFLSSRANNQLAHAQSEQLQRARRLIVRFHPDLLPTDSYPPLPTVPVLPDLNATMPYHTLQTEALLSTYAVSLQRASALLERAMRP